MVEHDGDRDERLRMIGVLAGGVAHDFNNLLMIITSFATFADSSLDEDHPARHDLAQVLTASARAADLTRQLLSFSNRRAAPREDVDFGECVQSVVGLLKRTVGEDIRVTTQLDGGAVVHAEPSEVEQLIMRLALHSRRAMPAGGHLGICVDVIDSTSGEGQLVRLEVSDTGDPALCDPRNWEDVVRLVHELGGTVERLSARDAASTSIVYLPYIQQVTGFDDAPRTLHGEERILVVEDHPTLREIAERSLTERGYEVVLAASESEARALVEEQDFDLVVADVVLPEGSGDALASWLGTHRPHLPVVLATGDRTRRQSSLTRPCRTLWKPYTPLMLLQEVRKLLSTNCDPDELDR